MADAIAPNEQHNFETFRDCFSEPVLKALSKPIDKPKKKRRLPRKSKDGRNGIPKKKANIDAGQAVSTEDQTSAEDLGDFIDYLSTLIFPSLPPDFRILSYSKYRDEPHLQDRYSTPLSHLTETHLLNLLPPPALDSLTSYALLPAVPDPLDLHHFFTPVFTSYIAAATAPPPIWSATRTSACELCARDWIPLTYHHLIPKSTHERVRKRGWHAEESLNSVAWLCRACHSFVHRLAGNEELARGWYTVELIVRGGVDGEYIVILVMGKGWKVAGNG
ncbi:hypothetical protein DPSP01_007597 [Paraphaeosphaeria sporulosa]|uniref:HNH domain-containing protein n=1 Tax=Paraphaeosphaeria sporulosa TaxID=1460663 RepID=A0A177C703_9PLEO|nr:uncharacterized protein CC84DRAFT_896916 [Paraphaeosphaeria sporulosa]OAG02527.1 hypothetical protein CC84DRAFT_896916 [Paraphaeosphaeria sporulosa]